MEQGVDLASQVEVKMAAGMHEAHSILEALPIVLCIAALTSVLFQRLHLPVVFGYLIAGLIIGPHVPIPLIADSAIVQELSELGVILLMFSLGLEFRIARLFEVAPTAGLTAIIETSVMGLLGFSVGRLFGWTTLESVFCGCLVAISSTTIIARVFADQHIGGRLRELVLGVLIVEDLIAIFLMTTLTAVATGSGLSFDKLLLMVAKLGAFLVSFVALGMFLVPRFMRVVVGLKRPETTLVASIGICFAGAVVAGVVGYSVALGAFIAGSLVAESGEGKRIEHLISPVRDMFAAIFFVSVGMLINPHIIAQHWLSIVVLVVVVVVGKVLGVTFGAFMTGNGTHASVRAGLSLAQIGEFSFIIAALGLRLKVAGDFLYPVAITVSALTTLATPFLVRHSEAAALLIDRHLPRRLQTFTSLYASWIQQLRQTSSKRPRGLRRCVGLIVLDLAVAIGVIVGASVFFDGACRGVARLTGLNESLSQGVFIIAVGTAFVPVGIGLFRSTRRLGGMLANLAFPRGARGRLDLSATPRRALVVMLQLGIAMLVGAPVVALTQPFVPAGLGVAVLGLGALGLSFLFWRRANELQGHLRAGAQVLVEAIARQGTEALPDDGPEMALALGFGEPGAVRLGADSPVVGKTLSELDLRGRTGATVLAIVRDDEGLAPTANEVLRVGDVLAFIGTAEAVAAATIVVSPSPSSSSSSSF